MALFGRPRPITDDQFHSEVAKLSDPTVAARAEAKERALNERHEARMESYKARQERYAAKLYQLRRENTESLLVAIDAAGKMTGPSRTRVKIRKSLGSEIALILCDGNGDVAIHARDIRLWVEMETLQNFRGRLRSLRYDFT